MSVGNGAFSDLLAGSWRRRPFFYDRLPIPIPDVLGSPANVAALLAAAREEDVIRRRSASRLDQAMDRAAALGGGASLEPDLQTRAMHVMVDHAERYDPACREVLGRLSETVAAALRDGVSAIRQPAAVLFLSSPGSRVHFHADGEQGFLLHLRGRKRVHVFPPDDEIFPEALKERWYSKKRTGIHGEYRGEFERKAQVFDLLPGTTLYIPGLCPHWVEAGPDVAVSLSFNFFSRSDRRREAVYLFNHKLRQRGLTPRPYGRSPLLDVMKGTVYSALSRVRRLVT